MPRRTLIGIHPERTAIEYLLANDVPIGKIAKKFNVSEISVWRNRRHLLADDPQYFENTRRQLPPIAETASLYNAVVTAIASLQAAMFILQPHKSMENNDL